jgi:TrmH family RNA methyltransferase
MISKNSVKYIQSLQVKKKRAETGLFVAEGPKLVQELVENGFEPEVIYATEQWPVQTPARVLVTEAELERLSAQQTANQAIGIFRQRTLPVEPVFRNQFTLVLDGLQDPGNLGTIIRTADWFGIRQLIASPDTVDVYNSKVVQSTMGSLGRVAVFYRELPPLLAQCGVPVYGALLNGQNLYEQPACTEAVLVIGNEANGIRPENLPAIAHAVTIPRTGQAESLNAAVATGILLSHLARK